VGLFFVVSGFEKLISPYENFSYVVQGYELLNNSLSDIVALVFPWIEFIVGVFMALGLWLKLSLRVLWAVIVIFIFVLAQALLRNLPIKDCGCFGELFSLPPHVTLIFDSCLLVIVSFLRRFLQKTLTLSLDNYFSLTR